MGNHGIETGKYASRDNLDANRVGVGITEDADDVDFLQMRC